MKRIESINVVKEYARENVPLGEERKLTVTPDGIWHDRVCLEIEGVRITVIAGDLQKAIQNAVNAHGY